MSQLYFQMDVQGLGRGKAGMPYFVKTEFAVEDPECDQSGIWATPGNSLTMFEGNETECSIIIPVTAKKALV